MFLPPKKKTTMDDNYDDNVDVLVIEFKWVITALNLIKAMKRV